MKGITLSFDGGDDSSAINDNGGYQTENDAGDKFSESISIVRTAILCIVETTHVKSYSYVTYFLVFL